MQIGIFRLCAILALAGTAACASSGKGDPSLAFVCQFETCECVPASGKIFGEKKVEPVRWTEDGKAYCPDGHGLSRSGQKSDFIKRYGG